MFVYTLCSSPFALQAQCGGSASIPITLSGLSGNISDRTGSSPEYAANLDCYWLIQPPNAKTIRLSFTRFSTEIGNDVLTVYNGADTTAPVLARLSGQAIPSAVVSTSGSLLLRFRTNASAQDRGWTAEYITSTIIGNIRSTPASVEFAPVLFGQSTESRITLSLPDVQNSVLVIAPPGFRLLLGSEPAAESSFADTLSISSQTLQASNGQVSLRVRFQPPASGRFSATLQVINGAITALVPLRGMAAPPVYWRPATGPFSASVQSLALSPDGTVFAGTLTGVYRSNSAGIAWLQASEGLDANSSLVVQSLLATNRAAFAGTVGGLFASSDRGRSWREVAQGVMTDVSSITANNDTIFACADGKLFRSLSSPILSAQPSQMIWQRMEVGGVFSNCIAQSIFALPQMLYVGSQDTVQKVSKLFSSSDGGRTWAQESFFLPDTTKIQSFSVLRTNTSTIQFIATAGRGLFRRINSGAWENVQAVNRNGDRLADTVYQVNVSRTNIFAATYEGVFRSDDGGTTWKKIVRGLSEQTVRSFASNDVELYAGTTAGVFRSTNIGETWQPVSTGLTGAVVTAIKEIRGFLLAGTLGSGIYRSADNGVTWQLANTGLNARSLFNFVSRSGVVFTTSFDGYSPGDRIIPGVYRSADNGITWSRVLEDSIAVRNNRNPFFGLFTSDRALYAGAGNGHVWISQNGIAWQLSQIAGASSPVAAITENAGASIFAATLGSGVFRSDDNGGTWRKMALPSDALTQTAYSIISNDGSVFVGTYNGLYRSTNNGATWIRLNFPAVSEKPTSMQVVDGVLYVATDGNGVWRTMDNGETWQELNDGLVGSISQVYSLFSSNGTDLYAGLRGGAVISTSLQLPTTAPRAFLEIPDTLRAKARDTLKLPIILSSLSGNLTDTKTIISGILRFNASLLVPISEEDRANSSVVDGTRLLPVRFQLTNTIGKSLAEIPLLAVLGNSTGTPIMLTNIQTTPSDAIVIMRNSGLFNLRGLFTGGVTRLFRSERAPLLVSLAPNPLQERATISYQVFDESPVSLTIANIFGQTVKTILNETLAEGSYEASVGTSDLATGTYFVVLQTPKYRLTQQCIIAR